MNQPCRIIAAAIAGLAVCGSALEAQPAGATHATEVPEESSRVARVASGSIDGRVVDGRGAPLSRATVSAVGTTMSFALTDRGGRFTLGALPPGPYLVRAHLSGFTASRSEMVEVRPRGRAAISSLQLRRSEPAVGTSGRVPPPPRVLAAGVAGGGVFDTDLEEADSAADSTQPDPDEGSSNAAAGRDDRTGRDGAAETGTARDPTAWRLRHLRRTVLRDLVDEFDTTAGAGGTSSEPTGEARLAMGAAPFTELPLSGQVNLFTISSFESPEDLFSYDGLPRGVAYLSVGAPAGSRSEWAVHGALTEGDLASWILAGSYESAVVDDHTLDLGWSYATQRYDGGNPAALVAVSEGSRNVGSLQVFDRWSIAPRVAVSYGGRYARYDYLEDTTLFSPMAGLSLSATDRTFIRLTMARRMRAPGAQEFLPHPTSGLWLPPQRTFAPLDAERPLQAEDSRHAEIAIEHRFSRYGIEVRRFQQTVEDQLVTVFGASTGAGRSDLGHYSVASAGTARAEGWGVTLDHAIAERLRGSVDYALTTAYWSSDGDREAIEEWVPSAARTGTERFHDVTTALETDIPETATRVYVLYKVNTAFARSDAELTEPGLDSRFNVQVNQGLPFLKSTGTRWEALVSVRNLFREWGDDVAPSSVYDELLVVRPPKRIVGGLQVQF